MKALVYKSGVISLEEVEKPQLPEGGALAKISSASVCGTDIRTFRFGNKELKDGRIIGHEACYYIEQIDSRIQGFKPGDRVVIAPAIGCGECASCLRGHTNTCEDMKTIGFQYDGTFAEYCAIPEQAFKMGNVIKLPDSIDDVAASVIEPIACVINGQSFLDITCEDTVLVLGSGFIGNMHAELARIKGAKKVILADISVKRREQAKKLIPEIDVLDSMDPDFKQKVLSLAGKTGVNVAITANPAGASQQQAIDILYRNGRLSLFGGLPGISTGFIDSNAVHYKELRVNGVHASTVKQNCESMELIKSGKIDPHKYLSIFPLDQMEAAIISLQKEDTLKAILKP